MLDERRCKEFASRLSSSGGSCGNIALPAPWAAWHKRGAELFTPDETSSLPLNRFVDRCGGVCAEGECGVAGGGEGGGGAVAGEFSEGGGEEIGEGAGG